MVDLNNNTITKLSSMIIKKEISVKELVSEYFSRIQRLDQGENGLNSILEINPEALSIAEKLDKHYKEKNSILFGIPILLKDNISTADCMHTSTGSLALADSIAMEDAEIVKTLRAKGAVILGKTNMTEFANYMTKGMPPGYSSRGGYVKSPYKLGADPSGSSTGSAVAVAANLCTASIGTDTSGSIVSPALKNGIVGFRPSMGTISQKGIIPISFTCDSVGPMTRTVSDSALLFSELSGRMSDTKRIPDLKEITVGISKSSVMDINEEEGKKTDTIIKEIEKAGATIKYIDIETITKNKLKTIQRYEFKYAINQYLKGLSMDYSIKSLKDIIEYNKKHKEVTLKYGQTLLTDAEENTRGDLTEKDYTEVLKDREFKKMQICEILKGIDICIMMKENLILQYTGMPIITIPHGLYNDGLPYGIILTAFSDTMLLKNAKLIEQLIGSRVEPKL